MDLVRLKELLDYDRETGIFRWKVSRGKGRVGSVAGTIRRAKYGYCVVSADGQKFYAHRLAWLFEFGVEPGLIDHINGDPSDNRIANLREATISQNGANSVRSVATAAIPGVRKLTRGSRFRAQVFFNGRHHHLGTFATAEAAHAAYVRAHIQVFGKYSKFSRDTAATAISVQ